jgi:hypothetical protein
LHEPHSAIIALEGPAEIEESGRGDERPAEIGTSPPPANVIRAAEPALEAQTAPLPASALRVRGGLTGSRARGFAASTASRVGHAVRPVVNAALFPWACLAVFLALWAAALTSVNVAGVATAGLGLVSVLPVTFWAAAVILMLSFCWTVTRRSAGWPVLTAHVLGLIALLHVSPAILYGTLRYSWAWKHVGVIDFISHNGVVFNLGGILGPYQGWPGFFALNSFLTSASGLNSSLGYAAWALPFNDLIWLGPVILIARAFSSDRRLIWTAAWLFTLGNWVGQDYFSPQAFTYFLYLTVIAVCVRWLWVPRASKRRTMAPSGSPAADLAGDVPASDDGRSSQPKSTRFALVALLVPLMAAIASTHQLTPFMLIVALAILAVFNQLRPRVLLPALATVIAVGWLAYGARDWLTVNYSQVLQGLGLPWANTSAHLVGLGAVPFDQVLIDWSARSLSAALGILAIIGFYRYRRHHNARARRSWLRIALLAAAAIPAVAANSYGGEIIFRVYLFAVPFMAIAAAAAFFPHPRIGRSIGSTFVFMVTTLLLLAGFSLGNFGQEAVNYFTPREVAASDWLYRTAPRGAEIIGADSNFPWAFVHYTWYSYQFLDSLPAPQSSAVLRTPLRTVTSLMTQGNPRTAYLILTRSQATEISMSGTWPAGAYNRLTQDVLSSHQFRIVYRNADVLILQLARSSAGSGR